MKRVVAALAALGLSACVSQSSTLVNDKGEVMHCDNFGFGLIGMPIAMAQHDDCLKKAKAAGYSTHPQKVQ